MTEPSEVQPILQQYSNVNNVKNAKMFDLVAFLVMLFFSLISSHPKVICGGGIHTLRDSLKKLWKHPRGRLSFDNLKKPLVEVSLHFHLQLSKSVFEWLLSYEVTSGRKEQ